jgi:hypothetical protein
VGTGAPTFRATVRGSLVASNTTYSVDLALNGEYRFESDTSGSSLLNDYLVTGSVTAAGYELTVQQRRRFELVVAQVNFGGATRFEDATSDQEWLNHTLRVGNDTFQWVNASKQKSFKNGQPSSVATYWQASGGVVRNGAAYGSYELRTEPLLGSLTFYLVLPGQAIELESWRNNP